jgi:hypothetical protein
VDLARSSVVQDALAGWETPAVAETGPADLEGRVFAFADLPGQIERPETTFALAFDGSLQEVAAREEYPSVRVDYLQLAGAAVVLPQFFGAWDGSFVDPAKQAAAIGREILNGVLPGSNVSLPGKAGVDTWREEVFKFFASRGVNDFGRLVSLIDALNLLFGSNDEVEVGRCPNRPCEQRNVPVAVTGGTCSACGGQIWPTDVLRTHEEYDPDGSNLTPTSRLMSICERLLMMLYIEGFAEVTTEGLGRGIFITDGPLALFGTVAPLKRRFVTWWGSLTDRLSAGGYPPPLMVGIEKSGVFVDHAASIGEWLPVQSVLHMDETYIRERIVRRDPSAGPYGRDEFYGRRFVYKTSTGCLLVVSVPRRSGQPYADPGCENLSEYPTLASTLEVLDAVQTRLYADAVIPIALAHSAAALPLGTGTRVLQDLARQALNV